MFVCISLHSVLSHMVASQLESETRKPDVCIQSNWFACYHVWVASAIKWWPKAVGGPAGTIVCGKGSHFKNWAIDPFEKYICWREGKGVGIYQ